jgi:hypothetical protein
MRNSIWILLLVFSGCARNIYQVPHEVQDLLRQGIQELKMEDQARVYLELDEDRFTYYAYLSWYTPEMKNFARLIRHSGRFILIHGERYPLISNEDRELSALYLNRGEQPDFHTIMSSHHGPWVSWVGAEVSDSWLSPRWQPKSDSLQKKE